MSTHPLLDLAVKAAGGLDRWHRVREIEATVSSGGVAFLGRLRGAKKHLKISASPKELRAVFTRFPAVGYRGVFDRSGVRIETENGHVVQQREDGRALSARHKVWDDLDLLYFKGYAQWSYLNEPFYLLMAGFEVREGEPWREGAETWRRLDRHPAHLSRRFE